MTLTVRNLFFAAALVGSYSLVALDTMGVRPKEDSPSVTSPSLNQKATTTAPDVSLP